MKEKEEIKKKRKNVFAWDDIEKLNSDNIILKNNNNNNDENNENNKNIRNSIEEILILKLKVLLMIVQKMIFINKKNFLI